MERAHFGRFGQFKMKEGVKIYIQLPAYDDFQGYGLGADAILSQIARGIYANFHKSYWQTSKHHLFVAKAQRNFLESSSLVRGMVKKDDLKHGRLFGRVGK